MNRAASVAVLALLALLAAFGSLSCTAGSGMSRGSDQVLLSVADEVRFGNEDLGKAVHLRLHQKLLISLTSMPGCEGKWTIEGVDRQKFLLLSTFVRGESGLNTVWLYEMRAYGYCSFHLIYTPYDESIPPRDFRVPVNISNIQ